MKFNFEDFSLHVRIAFADPCKQYYKLTLREKAKQFGISASTLSRATKGQRLDIDTILVLCFFLDLEISDHLIY